MQGSDRLLGVIKWRGPQRVADLAERLEITPEAARQHLLRLRAEGLVAAEIERGGIGRPSQRWALTQQGHARFPDTHAELTVRLIDAIRHALGADALEQVVAARESEARRAYAAALHGLSSLGQRVARLAAIRSREGYMAESHRDRDGFLLLENHCPICAAATACQGFCRSELKIFQEALGPHVIVERVEHILAGARRCAYRITRAREESDGMDRRAAGRRAGRGGQGGGAA